MTYKIIDLNWFKNNPNKVDAQMNFHSNLDKYLDSERYLISHTNANYILILKVLENGNRVPYRRFQRDGDKLKVPNDINIETNPLMYAIAIRLKYITMPESTSEKITKWHKHNGNNAQLIITQHGEYKIKVRNRHGKMTEIDEESMNVYANMFRNKKNLHMKRKSIEYQEFMKVNDPKRLKDNNPFRNGVHKYKDQLKTCERNKKNPVSDTPNLYPRNY